MKRLCMIRKYAGSVMLSLFLIASSTSPILAASESIELDSDSGTIGDEVEIYGENFDESYEDGDDYEYVYIVIYFSTEEAEEGDEIDDDVENYEIVDTSEEVDEDGEWETSFDVPDELTDGEDDEDVEGGTCYIYVTYKGDDEIVAVAEFEIAEPEIELDTEEGQAGTEVEITGTAFASSETITIEFDGDEVEIESGDDETDTDGEFKCTIILPESGAGDHTITVTDDAGTEAEADFTIEPLIDVSPTSIDSASDSITVSGTGFAENSEVVIILAGDEVALDKTDYYGSFTATFSAPLQVGLHSASTCSIEIEDDDGNSCEASITILKLPETAPSTPVQSTGNDSAPPAEPTGPSPSTPASPSTDIDTPDSGNFLGMPDWAMYAAGVTILLIAALIGFMLGRGSKKT